MAHVIFQSGRKPLDLDALQLPDGRQARSLDRDVLERELAALGVKFKPGSGRDALLLNYSLWLGENPPAATGPRVMVRPKPPEPPKAA
jgi:hypothetical protein